jgi:hypothetical protein
MNDIKISLSCRAFAVILIYVDIKPLGMVRVEKLFEDFKNGTMKGLRGLAFNYNDLLCCFNDAIFKKMIIHVFGEVFTYEKRRITLNGDRIYINDSISCSLEHDVMIDWIASLIGKSNICILNMWSILGLSDECPNDQLIVAFMKYLEAEYEKQAK